MRVSLIGAGKMGLPLACAIASNGAMVTACDVNASVVNSINAGVCPFDEPGVSEMLERVVAEGRLSATTDTAGAVAQSDVIVVIVPVMLTEDKRADLSTIESVTNVIGRSILQGAMVSYETTLPVGTTRRFGTTIEAQSGLRAGIDFDLVFSPERVKSRLVLRHLFDNPKVVGGITPVSAKRGEEFYARYLGAPVHNVGNLEASEYVKLAGMVYRDVNIALSNELAEYGEAVGVDLWKLLPVINSDAEAFLLQPGIGVGGHCTPVYPHFLITDARDRGLAATLCEQARTRNDEQPARMVGRLGDVQGRMVTILGVAFRPGVKEVAYSPAFALRDVLKARGAGVRAHDPLFSPEELRTLGFEPGSLDRPEILVLNTAHPEYHDLDFTLLASEGLSAVLDGRNLWNPDVVKASGVRYIGVGQ